MLGSYGESARAKPHGTDGKAAKKGARARIERTNGRNRNTRQLEAISNPPLAVAGGEAGFGEGGAVAALADSELHARELG